MPLSEEEFRRTLRKIKFDKTEPKLLVELGDREKRRIIKIKKNV